MRARSRDNFQSIYVFLFFVITFFVLQTRDPEKYQILFAFDFGSFLGGQYWRIVTYQFVESGLLSLFFDLLILYIMGSVVEEELGTVNFLALFALSCFGSAAASAVLGVPALGSFFSTYTLLFIFATMVPEQVFYIFFVLPVKVKWLGWLGLGFLLFLIVRGQASGIQALSGAALSYAYYLAISRTRIRLPRRQQFAPGTFTAKPEAKADGGAADRNLARFAKMKETVASGTPGQVDALAAEIGKEIVPGVNICPPADYKPEKDDRYCIRCEGFAECSVRWLRLSAEKQSAVSDQSSGEAPKK